MTIALEWTWVLIDYLVLFPVDLTLASISITWGEIIKSTGALILPKMNEIKACGVDLGISIFFLKLCSYSKGSLG